MAKKVSNKIFYSKILLFGEHIINKGATGLAIPVDKYAGKLEFGDVGIQRVAESNKSIGYFANYVIHHTNLSSIYNTDTLLEDIEGGLYFDSDIPQGYGLGSSGALVAAICHRYRKFKRKNERISELKKELAMLESFFHGKSSGLDAIVCYLHKAVVLDNTEVKQTFELPTTSKPMVKIFLIDTHLVRSTATYVNLFLEKCKSEKFMKTVKKSLVPSTNLAIDSFINRKFAHFLNSMKLISQLQYDMLPEFIPGKFKEAWEQGLQSNEYHLKICGAGGGGFIIGFAKADTPTDLTLRDYDVIELMKF